MKMSWSAISTRLVNANKREEDPFHRMMKQAGIDLLMHVCEKKEASENLVGFLLSLPA